MQVEVAAEKFNEAYTKAFKKLSAKVNIPGFRKGKAPVKMVENYMGKEAILNEAVDQILNQAYFEAVTENKLEVIDYPQFDFVQVEQGKEFIFKATVEVKPEVKLGTYKGVEVQKILKTVTAEDIEKSLTGLQQRYAKLENIEAGEVQDKDLTMIDFDGYVDGEAIPGGKGENYSLEIGSNTFIPGFEEKLIGLAIGSEAEIDVNFPEEYHSAELAGKPAKFKVKINSLKRKSVSPLDDEFAKDVSEFETLEELKVDVENKLKETEENRSKGELKGQLVKKVVEASEVMVPEVMIKRRTESYINDFKQSLSQQGLSFEAYIEYTGKKEEELREDYKEQAKEAVKSDLVLEAIAKVENIEVADQDVDEVIEKMAVMYKQEAATMKQYLLAQGSLDSIRESILLDKAVDLLVENAKVEEVVKES
jgi:trigger factor